MFCRSWASPKSSAPFGITVKLHFFFSTMWTGMYCTSQSELTFFFCSHWFFFFFDVVSFHCSELILVINICTRIRLYTGAKLKGISPRSAQPNIGLYYRSNICALDGGKLKKKHTDEDKERRGWKKTNANMICLGSKMCCWLAAHNNNNQCASRRINRSGQNRQEDYRLI